VGQLAAAGRKPALIARGYARDELDLHRRWHPDVPVIADPDRVRGARAAAQRGADVVVLDDGFQHRALARDLDIVALAAEQRFPGPMLPRGPYREPASALGRAAWIVVTRKRASAEQAAALVRAVGRHAPEARLAQVRLAPVGWCGLDGTPTEGPAAPVLAVAAIADPESFAHLVARESGAAVELLAFADHHEYTARDADRIRRAARGRIVATTEKDAVKLAGVLGGSLDARVLVLGVEVEAGGDALRAALLEAAGAHALNAPGGPGERTS
jgi:tetraacyldisaccharide 4'-kinase